MSRTSTAGHLSERVRSLITRIRRRLRWAWANETLQWVAPLVATTALALVVLARFVPWRWPEPAALGLAIAVVVIVAVIAGVQRVPDLVVARAADRGLQTRDAFASALQFAGDDDPLGFTGRIQARADHLAASADARAAVPLRWHARRVGLAALIAACAVGLAAFVTNPQDTTAAERAADRTDILTAAKEVEAEAARLDAQGADATEAAERLKALAEALRRADNLDAAMTELQKAADELQRSVKPDLLATKAATRGLERSLATSPLGSQPSATASEQLEQAAAGLDGKTPEQLDELADKLDQLAEAQKLGDPATAEALAAAAAAARAGNTAQAKASLGEAAAAHQAATSSANAQQSANEAANAAREANRRLGDRASNRSGKGQGKGTGQGQGKGQGQGQGQGKGQGQGQGGGGGNPQGNVGGGGSAGTPRPGRGGQGTGTGHKDGAAGQEPDTATVFDPVDAFGAGEEGTVDPGGEGDTETIGKGDGPTQAGTQRVPLADALPAYTAQATSALDSSPVPPSVRAMVLAYFDNLQGRK